MTEASQPVEIVFNFDTTGSMSGCINAVRKNIEKTVTALFKEIPNLRIGISANGDYQDKSTSYVFTSQDLTDKIFPVTQFARNVSRTHGFCWEEAYEYVLQKARTEFSWSLNAKKILVMIGDAVPHSPAEAKRLGGEAIDWREETRKNASAGIQTYSIQCLPYSRATPFWSELAEIGGGFHLVLDQFTDIENLIMAISYQQMGNERLAQYEEEVVKSGKMTRNLDRSFGVLSGQPRDAKGRFVSTKHKSSAGSEMVPVAAGRFQVLPVDRDTVIRDFVTANELPFKPGRGFYQFQKAETIQDYKEIIIRDKTTGDMFTSDEARDLLGIPTGMGKRKMSPKHDGKWDVFIQSTSYNRKLIGGSDFLYEVALEDGGL